MFEYESKIQHWVNRLSFLLRSELQKRFRAEGYDLSAEEWALLMVLWRKGPQQMGPLAATTLRDRTTVTRLVDRLVRKNYLKRTSKTGDRRQVIVDVTARGNEIHDQILAIVHALIADSSRGISQGDAQITLGVLSRMAKNLDESAAG